MVLFAQILLYMIALWIFWRILPVSFCQIYYFFTQTAKFNQIKFDLKTNELANQLLLKETGVTLTKPIKQ